MAKIVKSPSKMESDHSPGCSRFSTPTNLAKRTVQLQLPPTPALKPLGYGTGIGVYHMSPLAGKTNSPWALKKILKKTEDKRNIYSKRLAKEANILKRINHPNIVGFRGYTRSQDGSQVLCMEECDKCLGDLIEEAYENDQGPFSPEIILKVVKSICLALHHLHTQYGIIHGDIKSHNILLKGDFEKIKLCDFGVSVTLNEEGKASTYIGTPCWAPPESLINSENLITAKCDMFALGLTIYEMLSLQVPNSETLAELDASLDGFYDQLDESELFGKRPDLPKGLSDDYAPVIHLFNWMTEQNPDDRPTALEALQFLHKLTLK